MEMLRSERFITIAICGSLLVHAGVVELASRTARYSPIYLPPVRTAGSFVLQLVPEKPPVPPPDDMGDRHGKGTATANAQGKDPLRARKADQDQPDLTLLPPSLARIGSAKNSDNTPPGERGHGGTPGPKALAIAQPSLAPSQSGPTARPSPSPAALTPPSAEATPNPASPPPLPISVTAPPPAKADRNPFPVLPPQLTQVALASPPLPTPAFPKPPPPTLTPTPAPPASVQPTPPVPTPPKTLQASVGTGDGLAPGHALVTSEAQQSDSDSDAFTTTGSALIHDGRIEVRPGRKIKTVRPQLLLSGIFDTLGVSDPTLVLKIDIDPTGKVSHVDVVHSTGSTDIDLPCVEAVQEWWFEPRLDKTGKPIPDHINFTISFR